MSAQAEVATVEAVEAEAVQLQALLLSRGYLYELFHKLLGGTPNAELLALLCDPVTADVLDEFAVANEALGGFARFLQEFAAATALGAEGLLSAMRDEYTRVMVGPAKLPASPYESPYTGAHEMSLFQENTLTVRAAYREQGLRPRRVQAVPDDHVAMMCGFLAALARRAETALAAGDAAGLAQTLRWQGAFVCEHLVPWLPTYAQAVRNSKAGAQAVLYPQLLEALAAFTAADADFLAEAAFWAEGGEETGLGAQSGPGAVRVQVCVPAGACEAFAPVRVTLVALQATQPFGIQDNQLVSLD